MDVRTVNNSPPAAAHDEAVRVLARSVEGNAKQPHIWQSEQKESIRCRVIETVMMVALSIQELRRLLAHLQKTRTPDMSFRWHWSIWRRHHQAKAKQAHYRKRGAKVQL